MNLSRPSFVRFRAFEKLDLIKTVVPVPEKTAVRGEATPEDFDLYRLKFDRKTGELLELVRVPPRKD